MIAQFDAVKAINELKNGVLIVVIPGNHKKIERLKEELKNPKTKDKQKKRIKNTIEFAEAKREILVDKLWKGFEKDYHFSEFAFIYDTTTAYILNNRMDEVSFVKKKEQTNLKDKPLFFLRYGNTDRVNTTGIESWIITDDQFDDLKRPFPYYVAVFTPLKTLLIALVGSPSIVTRIGKTKQNIGYAFNKKFWDYYNSIDSRTN